MAKFRANRLEIIQQIVGQSYSDNGAEQQVPLNEMRFAFYTHLSRLTPKRPQALLTTRQEALKRAAKERQVLLNDTARMMKLGRTFEEWLAEALVSIGILKVGLTYDKAYELDGHQGDGYPYACVVDLDDYVFDLYAKKWECREYEGNFYRARIDDLLGNDKYDQGVVKKLQTAEWRTTNTGGDDRGDTISRGDGPGTDQMYDYVDLCDLYLPQEQRVLTVSAEFTLVLDPLCEEDWKGPKEGPYHRLWFKSVPGQLIPLAPALEWKDLHDPINELFLKLLDQGLRQKKIGYANAQQLDSAEATIQAKDGEVIPTMGNPAIAEQSFGGVDNNTLSFTIACMGLFNKMNGNIEAVAGLGPQSNTARQDEMINENSSKDFEDKQERIFEATEEVMRSIDWCIHTDPVIKRKGIKHPENHPKIDIPFEYTPDSHAGELSDYDLELSPFSYMNQSPSQKLAAVSNFMNGVAIPMYQAMVQQGVVIDWQKFIDLWSQYSQLPELKDILKFAPAAPQQQDPQDAPLQKSPTSNRNYTRHNVSDTSPDAERMQLMQSLMQSGGKSQAA